MSNELELRHHGVKGMKWGVRKKYYNSDGSLNKLGKARQEYKTAKASTKQAEKAYRKDAKGFGIEAIERGTKAEKKYNKAFLSEVNAEARYKATKAKTSEKAKKAEMDAYTRAMFRTGLPGSGADRNSGGRSTSLYNELKVKKGKAYADKVQKKVQTRAVASLVTTTTVMIGAAVVNGIIEANRG